MAFVNMKHVVESILLIRQSLEVTKKGFSHLNHFALKGFLPSHLMLGIGKYVSGHFCRERVNCIFNFA